MTRVTVRAFPRVATLEQLQDGVVTRLQDLASQINAREVEPSTNINMQGYRISNLSDPAAGRDAVNRTYLEKRLAEVQAQSGDGITVSGSLVITTLGIQIAY